MKFKSPCKDCENRTVGCHSKCKEYQEFRATRDKMNIELLKQREIFEYYHQSNKDFHRGKKRKRKRT